MNKMGRREVLPAAVMRDVHVFTMDLIERAREDEDINAARSCMNRKT